MSNGVNEGVSGGSENRRSSRAGQERGPNRGSVRKRGEVRAAEKQPWKYSDSGVPRFEPESLDAAAILKSVNETLLPVVEKQLEDAAERLRDTIADTNTDTVSDLGGVFRTELLRRVLPQFTEAVRSGVMEGIRTRQMHLAQLAVIHRQVLEAKSMRVAVTRIDHELARAGLKIVESTDDPSLFNVLEEEDGALRGDSVTYELLVPAYVDSESGKVVERGWLRAVPAQESPKLTPDSMKPGQKRRAKQTEAARAQGKTSKKSSGTAPRDRGTTPKAGQREGEHHRGQSRGVEGKTSADPSRESRAHLQGQWEASSSQPMAPRAVSQSDRRGRTADPKEMKEPRREKRSVTEPSPRRDQSAHTGKEDASGGAAGAQHTAPGGSTPEKNGYKQKLRATASRQITQRGTR
ncbi:hypothetical protein WJ438_26050 [Streptomyces sp. GD-15H]|uniref:hypothetical protein n=1 Tax=Streptomyces sp. GD-15H TaxID=3129112 RepID=UPI0032478A58